MNDARKKQGLRWIYGIEYTLYVKQRICSVKIYS